YGDDEHVFVGRFAQYVDAVVGAAHRGNVGSDAALGKADHRGSVVDRDGLGEFFAQGCGVSGGGYPDARHDLQNSEVPLPVVAGTVGAGHSGAVEHEGDACLVQGDIHEYLVEGAPQERCVHGNDGVQAAEGEPCGACDGVLFGDADIEYPVGMPFGELVEPGGDEHGGGDAHDPLVAVGYVNEFVGEDTRPAVAVTALERFARVGVYL